MPKKKKNQRDRTHGPSTGATSYSGPLILRPMKSQEEEFCTRLVLTGNVTAAAAIVANVFSTNPNTTPNWAGYASRWESFRVLRMGVHFEPVDQYNSAVAVGRGMIFVVVDYTDIVALASGAAALEYESCEIHSLNRPFKCLDWKANSPDLMSYQATSAPAARGSIKFYADVGAASATYGIYALEMLVQFRGRHG